MKTYFVSGHLDLTADEFREHYEPRILAAIKEGGSFVMGDARGADTLAQTFLKGFLLTTVTVFHMLEKPRNNVGFPTKGGYTSDSERDKAMTAASDDDIAWIREGGGGRGTAKNLQRRKDLQWEARQKFLADPERVRAAISALRDEAQAAAKKDRADYEALDPAQLLAAVADGFSREEQIDLLMEKRNRTVKLQCVKCEHVDSRRKFMRNGYCEICEPYYCSYCD